MFFNSLFNYSLNAEQTKFLDEILNLNEMAKICQKGIYKYLGTSYIEVETFDLLTNAQVSKKIISYIIENEEYLKDVIANNIEKSKNLVDAREINDMITQAIQNLELFPKFQNKNLSINFPSNITGELVTNTKLIKHILQNYQNITISSTDLLYSVICDNKGAQVYYGLMEIINDDIAMYHNIGLQNRNDLILYFESNGRYNAGESTALMNTLEMILMGKKNSKNYNLLSLLQITLNSYNFPNNQISEAIEMAKFLHEKAKDEDAKVFYECAIGELENLNLSAKLEEEKFAEDDEFEMINAENNSYCMINLEQVEEKIAEEISETITIKRVRFQDIENKDEFIFI